MKTPSPGLTMPQAVLLGSVVVSGGLFLGLRSREVPVVSPLVPSDTRSLGSTQPPTPQTPQTSLPSSLVPPSEARTAELGAAARVREARRLVQAALDARRPTMERTCFAPSVAKAREPAKYKLTLLYSFGPDGKQIARGTEEDREAARPDVTSCILQQLAPLDLGASVAGMHALPGVVEFP